MNGERDWWRTDGEAVHLVVIASPGRGKSMGSGPVLGGLRWRLRKLLHRALLILARRR